MATVTPAVRTGRRFSRTSPRKRIARRRWRRPCCLSHHPSEPRVLLLLSVARLRCRAVASEGACDAWFADRRRRPPRHDVRDRVQPNVAHRAFVGRPGGHRSHIKWIRDAEESYPTAHRAAARAAQSGGEPPDERESSADVVSPAESAAYR